MAYGSQVCEHQAASAVTAQLGYAVVDTETTGLFTGYRHRVAEIAVFQVDPYGCVTGEWSTLVNPDRDLGPQEIHGIRAADVRRAPRFEQIAGDLVAMIRGRVVVAHNWPFDAMHLRAEFERIDIDTPFHSGAGLCTMRIAGQSMPWARRSLIECCAAAGLVDRDWHTARDDAAAAAELLGYFLSLSPSAVTLTNDQVRSAGWPWPDLPRGRIAPFQRRPIDHIEPHFLARLVDRIPRSGDPTTDSYLSMLDAALLDRDISATEADALLDVAHELGLHRHDVFGIHHRYLRELARAAWADGVLTDGERHDINTVASLLGLDRALVDQVLRDECDQAAPQLVGGAAGCVTVGGLTLTPGDRVVLTGQMQRGRAEIAARARAAGLQTMSSVSRKTKVVVAADPDSLSGKAKDARALGVPVVSEHSFMRVLSDLAA